MHLVRKVLYSVVSAFREWLMAGKALIDQNPDPTEEEIKYALRGNICRCTGYKKIIEGIQLTAAILRGDAEIDYDLERGEQYGVGQRAFRVDVRKKVLGTANIQTILLWMVWYIYLQYAANTLVQEC